MLRSAKPRQPKGGYVGKWACGTGMQRNMTYKKANNFSINGDPVRQLAKGDAADIRLRIKRGQNRKDVRYIYNLTQAAMEQIVGKPKRKGKK